MGSPVRGPGAGLGADDLEIVGFNGTPLVECGRALPIVRRKSTDRFFKLSIRQKADTAFECDRQQIEAFAKEGRLTLFEHPLPLPKGLIAGPGDVSCQPMVLCVSQGFLDAGDCYRPEQHQGELLAWQPLPGRQPVSWVACASEAAVENLLNLWGHRLLERADDTLAQSQVDWARALRTADLGLCAAAEPALRWRLYVRYAAAEGWSPEPERVRRTFDDFVHREFPACSWEQFTREHASLSQTLRARGPRWSTQPAVSSPASAEARADFTGDLGDARAHWVNELPEREPALLPLPRRQRATRAGA